MNVPAGAAPAPPETTLLLRFGEMTLKSPPVRRRFTRILRSNIEAAFLREGLDCLLRDDYGHMYLDTSDLARAVPILQHTFGLTSLSPVAVLRTSDLAQVAGACASYALANKPHGAASFAIRARRTGSHPYSSVDVARACGSAVQTAAAAAGHPLKVDLSSPSFEVEVEVRENRAYLYSSRIPCAGGMPVGSAGKILFILRAGPAEADLDARAAWMLLKRGAQPVFVAQGEEATRTPSPAPAAAVARLAGWAPSHKLLVAADPLDASTLERLASAFGAHAVAYGMRAAGGQPDAPVALAKALPTFHPLLALSDEEVRAIPL